MVPTSSNRQIEKPDNSSLQRKAIVIVCISNTKKTYGFLTRENSKENGATPIKGNAAPQGFPKHIRVSLISVLTYTLTTTMVL